MTACRWVNWTPLGAYWDHSPTSRRLITCHWTATVACWSLIATTIAFYCWAASYNYNATASSSHACRHDYITTNARRNSMSCKAADIVRHPMSSRSSVFGWPRPRLISARSRLQLSFFRPRAFFSPLWAVTCLGVDSFPFVWKAATTFYFSQ